MKKFIFTILAIILLSCTTVTDKSVNETIKIWTIESFIQNNQDFIPQHIKEGVITHNEETNKTYISYLLNGDATYKLETEWKKIDKKLRIDRFFILQDIEYEINNKQLVIKKVNYDFIIKGVNTKKIINMLNNIVYNERENQSEGLILTIYRIWNPSLDKQVPYPSIKNKDKFNIIFENDKTILKNTNSKLILNFDGSHQWLGY